MLRRTSERKQASLFSSNRGKKIWTEEEDEELKKLVELHGTGNCKLYLFIIYLVE